MSRAVVWVDPSGLAVHPDDASQLVRVAVGAFGDPLSLWEPTAPTVPWLSMALLTETLETVSADETADPGVIEVLLDTAERTFDGVAAPPSRPYVLVPGCHAAVFDNRVKRLGLAGGRNSMKTWSAVTWADEVWQHPVNVIFAREVQSSMRASSKRAVEGRIEQLGLEGFDVQRDLIRHVGGGELSFIGLERNPDSVRSTENVRAVIVEEAHRITQRSIRILEPTLRRPGARAIYVWNRVQESDPVDAMFYGEGAELPTVHTTWRDNPFIAPSVVTDVIRDLDRDPVTARHVWGGEPLIRSDARVFPDSAFTVADIDDQVPEQLVARYGADWGFAADPTVLVQVYVWGSTLYVRREAYALGLGVDEVPSLFAGSDNRDPPRWANPKGWPGLPGAQHGRIYADSAGPAYIRYLRDRGFTGIRRSKKGPGSVENGIAKLRSFDIVVHPSCVHTLEELRTHRYETDRKTEEVLPRFVDDANHTIDALRYSIQGIR